ncbi:MAG: hypothetical protein U1E36_00280 [Rickettsiales bacterium]
MWDEITHYAKLIGGWLGVRVINAISVFFAMKNGVVESLAMAPVVALPTGLAFATYVSYSESKMEKRRMTNAYRHEIAELTGKPWKEVSVTDLETLAKGDHEEHISPVHVFEEKLDRNRNKRFLSLMGHIAGAAVAFGAIWFGFEHFNSSFESMGTAVKDFFTNWIGTESFGKNLPVMASAGLISLAGDIAFTLTGERILGYDKPTVYDQVQHIKHDMRLGRVLTEEKVFGVVLAANPGFSKGIEERYGQPFEKLPAKYQQEIINAFDQTYPIKRLTAEIEGGLRSPNEIAFFAYGQESGVPLKQPKEKISEKVPEKEKQISLDLSMVPATTRIVAVSEPVVGAPGKAVSAAQHEGYLNKAMAQGKMVQESFVKRLEQELATANNSIKI